MWERPPRIVKKSDTAAAPWDGCRTPLDGPGQVAVASRRFGGDSDACQAIRHRHGFEQEKRRFSVISAGRGPSPSRSVLRAATKPLRRCGPGRGDRDETRAVTIGTGRRCVATTFTLPRPHPLAAEERRASQIVYPWDCRAAAVTRTKKCRAWAGNRARSLAVRARRPTLRGAAAGGARLLHPG
jgi:hypothetical protein